MPHQNNTAGAANPQRTALGKAFITLHNGDRATPALAEATQRHGKLRLAVPA